MSGITNVPIVLDSYDEFAAYGHPYEKPKECAICLEDFKYRFSKDRAHFEDISYKVTFLACGHILHTECLANHIKAAHPDQKNKCIMCRHVYKIDSRILTKELLKEVQIKIKEDQNDEVVLLRRIGRFGNLACIVCVIVVWSMHLANSDYVSEETKVLLKKYILLLGLPGIMCIFLARNL